MSDKTDDDEDAEKDERGQNEVPLEEERVADEEIEATVTSEDEAEIVVEESLEQKAAEEDAEKVSEESLEQKAAEEDDTDLNLEFSAEDESIPNSVISDDIEEEDTDSDEANGNDTDSGE